MSDLVNRLRIHAGMVAMCEPVSWGSDTALMNEAGDLIEQLKAALATARNDVLEEAAIELDVWDDIYGDNAAADIRALKEQPK